MNAAASPPRSPLHVADHVRSCVIDDQVVLLDLRCGRYLGLDSRQWQIILAAMRADEVQAISPDETPRMPLATLETLHRRQILTSTHTPSRKPDSIPQPTASFDAHHASIECTIDARQISRFISATTLAALWLRFRSLHAITQSVRTRHLRCASHVPDRTGRLRNAIAVFDRLRPLAYTSKNQCLFDSLALTLYLAHQGIAAHWVIGVTTRPFKAHAWVQDGSEVLNDLHERVGLYTPLLVV